MEIKSLIMGFISSTTGASGATVLGKTIVSNLLKLIPGAGTVGGAAISGTTAGLITAALGEKYILIMVAIAKGEMTMKDFESKEGKEKSKGEIQSAIKYKQNSKRMNIEPPLHHAAAGI